MIMISKDKLEQISSMLTSHLGSITRDNGNSYYSKEQKPCEDMIDELAIMLCDGGTLFEIQEKLNLEWREEDEIEEWNLESIATEANMCLRECGISHECSARLDASCLILEFQK